MRGYAIALLLVAAAAARAGAGPITLTTVRSEAGRVNPNLLANYSFEELGASGLPAGWGWDKRNTDATCTVDESVAHSGKRSIRLTSGTPFGANVYGMLARVDPIRLDAGKPYTLSAWVRAQDPGNVGLMTGAGWQFRSYVPATGNQWRRMFLTFTPAEADRDCIVRISVESATKGVWLDDLKLEEGAAPTPVQPADNSVAPLQVTPLAPDTEIQGDGPFTVSFAAFTPSAADLTVEARLGAASLRAPLRADAGASTIVLSGNAVGADDAPKQLTLRLLQSGKEVAAANVTMRFYSASNAQTRVAALAARLPALKAALDRLRARGADVSYPLVTYTVLDNFVAYTRSDARGKEVRRAMTELRDLEPMAVRLDRELKRAAASGGLPAVPRWTGATRPVVRGSALLAPTRTAGKAGEATRPVFFYGYGHFGQVVSDIEKWPAYGTNIIQIELGPSAVFPAEDKVDEAPIQALRKTLDRAQKSGVAVCLLISPHYMPQWALDKWPDLKKRREGFFGYCLHAPEGQELLRRFIGVLIPAIKDHPALQSICLSNEPVNEEEPCAYAQRLWSSWLEKKHGTVAAMNAAWGTDYASFDAAPLPNPFGPRPATPVWMDFIRFNQEFFAGWHKMLADAVHASAPDLPVHAKAMTWTLTGEGEAVYGVDATLFGGFSQINGNDAVNWYSFGSGEFAQGWQGNAMGHDLQRSVLDGPVFNSENHIIVDRETRYVPAEHVRAALWQAAAHGQSATTIWVWERTDDPKSDFAGSIMHRPGCAEAVGVVNCDLNRAALEMTAIQQAPPQALILESVSGRVWDAGHYGDAMGKVYTALAFTGLKVGYVTERQLEAGIVPAAPILFIPAVTHVSDAAFTALQRYKGRIVYVGEGDLLGQDDYGHPRAARLAAESLSFRYGPTTWRELWQQLLAKLPVWGIRPSVSLTEAGKPAWGVEWRTTVERGDTIVNTCNYRQEPVTVSLVRGGSAVGATDVLTGAPVRGAFTLKPLEVRLLRLGGAR